MMSTTASSPWESNTIYPGRLAVQQRVLPSYRLAFFDTLALACEKGLSVFAGQPGAGESIQTTAALHHAQRYQARNLSLLNVNSPYYLCWQRGLVGWLESWQPDALIVEANPRYLSTRGGVRWMHQRGRPVIGWGLGSPQMSGSSAGWFSRSRLEGRKRFYSLFDALVAYSSKGAEEYRALGFPADRVYVAPNSVAPRPTQPPVERPQAVGGRLNLLYVGRLQARKRIDLLLRACAELPEAVQPRLVIVGDGPARSELQEMGGSIYPLASFPGAAFGEALDRFFNQAHLFVLPGTGGLALQQAMAHGLPVIAAEGDGTQEDLVRSGNGWLVVPGDRSSLTRALQAALSDPGRLRLMGLESYRIVRDEANLEKMVEGVLAALQRVSRK